jgi:hypothetical protein
VDLLEWNRRLVQAIFYDPVEITPEIRRIDATDGFLAEVAGFSDPKAARESFLASFPHNEADVRRLFANHVLDDWLPTHRKLPFYAQLHLTILAASADESSQDLGNFRWRLAQMLGLPTGDYVSSGCLPLLWQQAQAWSQQRFARHQDTCQLILPDPGHENIIGYSKGLAFPGFRDQTRLAELLTDEGLDASSHLPRLLTAIRSRIRDFSNRFQHEFAAFEQHLVRQDLESAQDCVFWETIVETSWRRTRERSEAKIDGCRIEIDPIDPYDLGLWCYCHSHSNAGSGWIKDSTDRLPDGRVAWYLDRDATPGGLLDRLRSKWLKAESRSFMGNRLGHALADGCIGFVQDESGRWFDTLSLPDSGVLWLILHKNNDALLEAPISDGRKSIVYKASLPGSTFWTLFGPIDITEALREWFDSHAFAIDFFAPRLVRRRVAILDSIQRADGAHLYLPPIVPAFRCRDAKTGSVVVDETSYDLIAYDDRLMLADSAAIDPKPSLEMYVVTRDMTGRELARGRFRFTDSSAALEFKPVRSPDKWLESSVDGHLLTFSVDPGLVARTDVEDQGFLSLRRPLSMSRANIPGGLTIDLEHLDERWWRMTEILSAIFARRYAWPIGECADLLGRLWGSRSEGWARLEDLVQNGILRVLHTRHWSGRMVVAGLPVAVIHQGPDVIEIRLVGLLSAEMRALVGSTLGVAGRVLASPDRSTAGALIYLVDETERLDTLRAKTGWPLLVQESLPELRMPAFENLLASPARSDLDGYDDKEKQTWSTKRRFFLPPAETNEELPRLEKWPARGLQDLYVLHRRNGSLWNTDCRTWALLVRAVDARSSLGESLGDGTIHLSDPSLSLPRPLAWRTVALGGGVCFRLEDGTRLYAAGEHWSPSQACEHWIERQSRSSSSPCKKLSAHGRYELLLQRKRLEHRSM